jgi:hypothetical protein
MTNGMGKGFIKAAVIVAILYAVFYYFSYNRWSGQSLDDVDATYKEDKAILGDDYEDNPVKGEDKTDTKEEDNYKLLYEKYNFELLENNYGEEFFNMYYGGASFNSEYYIYLAIVNLMNNENLVNCNLEKTYTLEEVSNKIVELFGEVEYDNKSFTTKNNYLSITFNNDQYKVKVNNKCGGFDYSNGGIKNKYDKALSLGNELYIYEKAFYLDYSTGNDGNLQFNYHSLLSKDSPVVGHDLNKLNMDDFTSYIYKFTMENGGYKLVSVSEEK